MKNLSELTFEEIQKMYAYAIDLAASYVKDAEKHYKADETERGDKFMAADKEWTEYARLLDLELQSRIKAAVTYQTAQPQPFI
ncbi:hypothetical protein GCM10028803_22260 [Larkinella knui]|uniref:Uncharacterized protein n=1 Tax=Larkinella knui TaxID=2025310 RepID=A0A3P1CW48_9BACT|nr:hypothetical protein [Larkinella knui]RRB17300.1 hypothetical protein EHT87_03180 [Larkinella knui]